MAFRVRIVVLEYQRKSLKIKKMWAASSCPLIGAATPFTECIFLLYNSTHFLCHSYENKSNSKKNPIHVYTYYEFQVHNRHYISFVIELDVHTTCMFATCAKLLHFFQYE